MSLYSLAQTDRETFEYIKKVLTYTITPKEGACACEEIHEVDYPKRLKPSKTTISISFSFDKMHEYCRKKAEEKTKPYENQVIPEIPFGLMESLWRDEVLPYIQLTDLVSIISEYHWGQFKPVESFLWKGWTSACFSICTTYNRTWSSCSECGKEIDYLLRVCHKCWNSMRFSYLK